MNERGLPIAAFGKPPGTNDAFQMLWVGGDFSAGARRATQTLARAFQLQGGGPEVYPACFALWPVDDGSGWVAARLRDAGPDSLGRPHTLQIDAVYVPSPDLLAATAFLEPAVWPRDEWQETTVAFTSVPPVTPEVAARVFKQVDPTARPTILRATHKCYLAPGFDLQLVDANGDKVGERYRKNRPKAADSGSGCTIPHDERDANLRTSGWGTAMKKNKWVFSCIVLVGVVGVVGVVGFIVWEFRQTEVDKLNDKLADAEKNIEQEQRRAEENERNANDAKAEKDKLREQIEESRRDNESFSKTAGDFGITNANQLREVLKDSRKPAPRQESKGEKMNRLFREADSVLRDLRNTWETR